MADPRFADHRVDQKCIRYDLPGGDLTAGCFVDCAEYSRDFSEFFTKEKPFLWQIAYFYILTKISIEIHRSFVYNDFIVEKKNHL